MIIKNYDNSIKISHNPNWPYIPGHPPYWILIIGGSGSCKTNVLLNLKNQRPDIEKNYIYVKDPFESKYELLINGKGKVGIKKFLKSESML